jgi:4-amino-4-deoxy-L-arabinose transferase-like glycosyltransferase
LSAPRPGVRRWLGLSLFFLWLATSLAAYYLVQNALLQPVLERLGAMRWLPLAFSPAAWANVALDLLAAAWIALVGLGVGRAMLSRLAPPGLSPLEELLLGLGLGLGALGLLTLALGLAGWLGRPLFLALTALLTVVTALPTARFLHRAPPVARPGLPVTLFLVVSVLLSLSLALLPPTSWDGLFYHLTGPRLAIEAGSLSLPVEVPHFSFPALMEVLFTYAMLVRGEVAAVLLHALFGLMLAGLVFLMARRLFGLEQGWTAVLFLLAAPMVLTLSGWAYNDLALAFYAVSALYALLRWRPQSGDWRWLALSALLAGLAMSLKYTSFVAPLVLVGLILWWQRGRPRLALRSLLLFGGLALLVAMPWYLRNILVTGNPVHPFLFGGQGWDEFRAAAYAEAGTGLAFNPETCTGPEGPYLVGQNPGNCRFDGLYLLGRLLTLPVAMTLGLDDASADGPIGPLFLVFLPLLLLYALRTGVQRPAAVGPLLLFALAHYLFWAAGAAYSAGLFQSRLMLPALAALCPALAWLLHDSIRYDLPRFSLRGLLRLVLAGVLLAGLAVQTANWLAAQPWAYLSGSESRPDYLRRTLGAHYAAMELVNERVPPEGRVKLLWEPRSYYCRVDCSPDSILDAFGHAQYLYRDAAAIAGAWRREGYSHILLFHTGLDFVRRANSPTDEPLPVPEVLADLLATQVDPVASVAGGAYRLYQLNP